MKPAYRRTMYACFVGYFVQAIVVNFVPLLFVTFQTEYHIPLSQITLLISANFIVQLLVDLLSAGFVDRIGYRATALLANTLCMLGILSLTVFPEIWPTPFAGLFCSVILYAVGGGLLEVLISPIVEACPTDNKEKAMSLLHSFYSWGQMGVVLLSTLFFALIGVENWKWLAALWALVPAADMVLFTKAPIYKLEAEDGEKPSLRRLFSQKLFWLFMLIMLCSGAAEQAVAQWTSTFAERGLGVSKTVGDLAGPMAFAALMGVARLLYGRYGERMDLERTMIYSTALCVAAYACVAFVPSAAVGLIACAVCGFSVGILWPGSLNRAAVTVSGGGTALFSMLALAGDLGCTGGPTLAGMVSGRFDNDLHRGLAAAMVFPLILLAALLLARRNTKKAAK